MNSAANESEVRTFEWTLAADSELAGGHFGEHFTTFNIKESTEPSTTFDQELCS